MLWLREKESRLASEAKVGLSFPLETPVVLNKDAKVRFRGAWGTIDPIL